MYIKIITYQIKITQHTLWAKTSTCYVIKRLHPLHTKICTVARWDADTRMTWGGGRGGSTVKLWPPCFLLSVLVTMLHHKCGPHQSATSDRSITGTNLLRKNGKKFKFSCSNPVFMLLLFFSCNIVATESFQQTRQQVCRWKWKRQWHSHDDGQLHQHNRRVHHFPFTL